MTRKEKICIGIGLTLQWLVMLAPVLLLLGIIVEAWLDFRFLRIWVSGQGLVMSLVPTIVLGVMQIVKRFTRVRAVAQTILVCLCVLYMLPLGLIFCAFTFDFYSETEDIAHYMQLDDLCYLYSPTEELFPDTPKQEGKYRYYCDYNHNSLLFAEWTLPPEELAAEVARAEALLSVQEQYQEMQHGDYRCLIATGYSSMKFTPFEVDDGTNSHDMVMFAYNEETGVVRYLENDTYAQRGQVPWYMTLDWGDVQSETP